MNDTIEKLYAKYLHLTDGDKAAAANLALAATFLSGRNEAPTIPAGVPLTVKEAAAQLRVSTRRIYELCATGDLLAFKVGRSLRIAPEMLEEYRQKGIVACCREPFSGRPHRCL